MSIWRKSDEDILAQEDRPMAFSGGMSDERRSKLERAKEIHSGLTMGTFERDEEVWEFVRQLRERDE